MLRITDSEHVCEIDKEEAIQLELKLNVTQYGKQWSYIGDKLYAFGSGSLSKSDDILVVSAQQYAFLEILQKRASWKDCYDL